jgi:hypothetical protein
MREAWSEIVTIALLGTERRRPADDLGEPWAECLVSARSQPAERLLDLAVGYRAVLRTTPVAKPAPEPPSAPPGQLPTAPRRARNLLDVLLLRPDPTLITIWLTECVDHGMTIGPQSWTPLADHLVRHRNYPPELLRAALGPHGMWFLERNPRWSVVHARLGQGQEIHLDDHDGADDQDVAGAGRLNRHAMDAVRLGNRDDGTPFLIIIPPAVDDQMRRDGISPRPPARSRIGAGVYVIRQLVAAADAGLWQERWQHPPEWILDLASATAPGWTDDLCAGWAAAAVRDGHVGWAVALTQLGYRGGHSIALQALLPARQRLALLHRWLEADRPAEMIMDLVLSCPDPWPRAVSMLALHLLGTGALGRSSVEFGSAVGARVPLEAVPQNKDEEGHRVLTSGPSAVPANQAMRVREALAALEETLLLRSAIHQAFQPDSTADDPRGAQ